MLGEARLRPVAQREQRLLGAESRACPTQRDHFLGRHRVGAGLAGIAAERAVAAVVAAQRGERHEHLHRKRHDAPVRVTHGSGAGEQVVEPLGRPLDEPYGLVVGDHDCSEGREVALRRGWPVLDAAWLRSTAWPSFPLMSWAKRSMLVSAALSSDTVGSNTKCVTPAAAYARMSAITSAAVPCKSGRSPPGDFAHRGRT